MKRMKRMKEYTIAVTLPLVYVVRASTERKAKEKAITIAWDNIFTQTTTMDLETKIIKK